MIDLRNRKIGLVLSGGGAKGAYQVGMFHALEQLGLSKQIVSMSGCSIGAYAAVIYALSGNREYRDFLFSFESMMSEGQSLTDEDVERAKMDVASRTVGIKEFSEERRFWKYETLGLHRYFRRLLAGNAISRSGMRLNVCAYSLEDERPEYFSLNEMSSSDQEMAIIGSGSLEFLFKASLLDGRHYLDGGIIPSICASPSPADKIPLAPMAAENVDFILINYLIASDFVNTALIPSSTGFLELRPSAPLEAYPGAGTLDFSAEKLMSHEKMGYTDTLNLLEANCIY